MSLRLCSAPPPTRTCRAGTCGRRGRDNDICSPPPKTRSPPCASTRSHSRLMRACALDEDEGRPPRSRPPPRRRRGGASRLRGPRRRSAARRWQSVAQADSAPRHGPRSQKLPRYIPIRGSPWPDEEAGPVRAVAQDETLGEEEVEAVVPRVIYAAFEVPCLQFWVRPAFDDEIPPVAAGALRAYARKSPCAPRGWRRAGNLRAWKGPR